MTEWKGPRACPGCRWLVPVIITEDRVCKDGLKVGYYECTVWERMSPTDKAHAGPECGWFEPKGNDEEKEMME